MIKKNDELIILKFKNIVPNCIDLHIKVIHKCGFCWFGKVGKSLNEVTLKEIDEGRMKYILLYSKGELYLAHLCGFTKEKMYSNIPDYYKSELYDNYIYPSNYLKIDKITTLPLEVLDKLVSKSSKRVLRQTIGRCMNPIINAIAIDDIGGVENGY